MSGQIDAAHAATASICSSYDGLRPDGRIVPGEEEPGRAVELIEGTRAAVRSTVLRGCWWHISGCAIRLAAFMELGGFREHMPQLGDWDWLLRALSRGHAIEYIPRTLLLYRLHASSVSSESFRKDRDITEWVEIVARYREYLSQRDLVRAHAYQAVTCARRAGRGMIRGDAARVARAAKSLLTVTASWGRLASH
jgi:hypothetical protein